MNDSDIPKTPDDFSKTTPNVDKADWGKTNYNYPAQPPAEDWGNTVANVRRDDMDFGKTFTPGAENPKTPDWGITQDNIRLPNDDFGGGRQDASGGEPDYGATTPYFRLPEAERAKYQNVPLTPTQEQAAKKEEENKKGGVPGWLWVSGGLLSMFLFALVCLLIVYIFVIRESGYDVVVKAPEGSTINVDNSYWAQRQPDGSYILKSLEADKERIIKVINPNYECEPLKINSKDGVNPPPLTAVCKQVANVRNECLSIKPGEEAKAAKCANEALDALGDNFSIDALLAALNLYIIKFPSGKYDIPQNDMPFLIKASGYLKKMPPNVVIEVGGHTDDVGSDTSNQTLSDNRAKSVRSALLNLGVKSEALTEKGYGESQPRDDNKTEEGKFRNRRIQYSAAKK